MTSSVSWRSQEDAADDDVEKHVGLGASVSKVNIGYIIVRSRAQLKA